MKFHKEPTMQIRLQMPCA